MLQIFYFMHLHCDIKKEEEIYKKKQRQTEVYGKRNWVRKNERMQE
jgi:hypothetical protein